MGLKSEVIASGGRSMERPGLSWSLCLTPAKKYGRAVPEEESEMRKETGLRGEGLPPV